MYLLQHIADIRAVRPSLPALALVPTMGALHAGHEALIRRATELAPHVAVSIFVNPTQFGPREDFSKYPRMLEADLKICQAAGAEFVFAPAVEEMYPPGSPAIAIEMPGLSDTLEGAKRPGHFRGVCQVVLKLLHIFTPTHAVFGAKDYQQYRVIAAMVQTLDLPVEIVACPTVRDADGLALSSRNAYLSAAERKQALAIPRAIEAACKQYAEGFRQTSRLTTTMLHVLLEGHLLVDYVAAVDPVTFKPVAEVAGPTLLAVAARAGGTRLIDNAVVG
jgi:pantoate--beta-alanine ligase